MGKINIYGWGGVNVTKNPIQLENNELTKAQNAFRDATGEHGALRKREGLLKINSIALSGAVNGFINVPINLIGTRRFLIGVDQDTTTAYQWITSTDTFATTATSTTPAACSRGDATQALGWFGGGLTNRGTHTEKLFIYPGDYTRGTPQPVRAWDGTFDKILFEVPLNAKAVADNGLATYAIKPGSIPHMLVHGTKLFIVSMDFNFLNAGSSHYSRVLMWDFETQTLSQVGEACTGYDGDIAAASTGGTTGGASQTFTCVEMHQGWLYAGVGLPPGEVSNSTASGVYRIRPGVDDAWVYDFDNSGAADTDFEVVTCMASYKGKLYVGTMDVNSASARLLVRDFAGSYTSSATVGNGTNSAWTSMKVFGDNLYACSYDNNGASSITRIHKFDGTSWTIVKTIDTGTSQPRVGVDMIVHNGTLFVLAINTIDNAVVTYSSNGTSWTDQNSNMTGGNIVSVFGVLAT